MGITRRAVIALKKELVEGTPETLSDADAGIEVQNISVTVDGALIDRDPARAALGAFPTSIGNRSASITWEAPLKGSGTPTTPPAVGLMLQALQAEETVNTSVVYTPGTQSQGSYTVALYEDGRRYLIYGARGSGELTVRNGEHAMLSCTLEGVWGGYTDTALLSPTYDTTVPPVCLNVGFTLDATTIQGNEMVLDFGNEIEGDDDWNSVSGFNSFLLTRRTPGGSMILTDVAVADYDLFGKAEAGTPAAVSLTVGSTAGNRIKITGPNVQWALPTHNPRGQRSGLSLDLQWNPLTGGDDWSLEFD